MPILYLALITILEARITRRPVKGTLWATPMSLMLQEVTKFLFTVRPPLKGIQNTLRLQNIQWSLEVKTHTN
jgi:hypothetical protein